jgi:hypothetical protein
MAAAIAALKEEGEIDALFGNEGDSGELPDDVQLIADFKSHHQPRQRFPSHTIPPFVDYESYLAALKDPRQATPEHYSGTALFRDAKQFSEAVKVTKLIGWLDLSFESGTSSC